ncbi:MAG: hypothetical protein IJW83_01905 [Clostridia bacterium]|nr:hypothetical protein [Clostridia bacterium]
MGFGTLFVAFLLLFNFIYVEYTDLICALLMALALVKLSPVRREFRAASYVSLFFAALGAAELGFSIYESFHMTTHALSYLAMARNVLLLAITGLVLLGIRATAKEVGLGRLAVRCESTLVMPLIVYASQFVLEIPGLFASDNGGAQIFAAIILLLAFVMHAVNAVTIYKAYARICMPEDVDMNMKKPPSRFAFINTMREKQAEQEARQAKAKQAAFDEKMRRKKEKRKKK